jgi:3-methyladenine DNA glycosylase AlkC
VEKEKFSLKDHLFNQQKVLQIANEIKAVHKSFDVKRFTTHVLKLFPSLELKQRITHIAAGLKLFLPDNYADAISIIVKALPAKLNPTLKDDDFGEFIYASYSEFVANYGIEKKNLKISLKALYEITQRFSVEYAIRIFINKYPEEVFQYLLKWSKDKNYHVRRLCSEGTRPTLPWATKINYTVEQTLPLLENLYHDNARFVTRSVANHLNDISKKQPKLVIETLQKWQQSTRQNQQEMDFIVKHSLRTLIKDGYQEALAMVGFGNAQGVSICKLKSNKNVTIGNTLEFSFSITCEKAKPLLIDYIVHFVTKQQKSSAKVFKLKSFDAEAGHTYQISKQHKFLAGMTTRSLNAGTHKVDIQVNGTVLAHFKFELED